MAWIKMIEAGDAAGDLKAEYDRAIGRAGKVFNILKVQSLNPKDAARFDGALSGHDAYPFGPLAR